MNWFWNAVGWVGGAIANVVGWVKGTVLWTQAKANFGMFVAATIGGTVLKKAEDAFSWGFKKATGKDLFEKPKKKRRLIPKNVTVEQKIFQIKLTDSEQLKELQQLIQDGDVQVEVVVPDEEPIRTKEETGA